MIEAGEGVLRKAKSAAGLDADLLMTGENCLIIKALLREI